MPNLRPERVLGDLATLRTFGAYETGVHRPTLSPEDVAAREWFAARLRQAGLDAEIDGIGNILGRHWSEDTRQDDIVLGARVFADALADILRS